MERNVLVENMAVLMRRHLVDEYGCTEHRAETIADWLRGFKNKGNAELAEPKERIIAAAIQVEGMTLSLPLPARHGQVISAAHAMRLPEFMIMPACQGFLTSTGRFVNRVQAKQIAHMAGQPQLRPESERHDRDLFSEDLW